MNSTKKIGDTISWTFPKDHGGIHAGKTYSADVVSIDFGDEAYLVYAEYGQDMIGFDKID